MNDWERDASIKLRNRDTAVIDTYHEYGRIRPVWSDLAIEFVVDAWQADHDAGHDTIIVADTAAHAAEISAVCQQRLIDTEQLRTAGVATLADGNTAHIGDLVQTRRNTRDLTTSNGHRVLNRDVWRVTDTTTDGQLVAVHTRAGHTATITTGYAAADVVLAYATTIAGAQGRTTDRSHVLVTPRTTAQSLYVGMTRGRHTNTAHVVCDAHDHDELQLGERTPRDAFTAAMQRDSDGNLSAHTIAQRWHQQRPAREAARTADRQLQHAESFWNRQTTNWPARLREDLSGSETEIVRVLARLASDSERSSAVAQSLRVATSGRASTSDFVVALRRFAAGGDPRPSNRVGAPTADRVRGATR